MKDKQDRIRMCDRVNKAITEEIRSGKIEAGNLPLLLWNSNLSALDRILEHFTGPQLDNGPRTKGTLRSWETLQGFFAVD